MYSSNQRMYIVNQERKTQLSFRYIFNFTKMFDIHVVSYDTLLIKGYQQKLSEIPFEFALTD